MSQDSVDIFIQNAVYMPLIEHHFHDLKSILKLHPDRTMDIEAQLDEICLQLISNSTSNSI